MRSLVIQMVIGAVALLAFAGFVIDPGSRTRATAADSRLAPRVPASAAAVWFRPDITSCDGDLQSCLRSALAQSGAPRQALEFYDATGSVLDGFAPGTPVSVGRAEPWMGSASEPALAFLGGDRPFEWVEDALRTRYQVTPKHGDQALTSDPMYEAFVMALASVTGEPVQPFASQAQRLESISALTGDEQQVLVQVGVANGCASCGTGVAERYAFVFKRDGRLDRIDVLGLCAGRPVPGSAAAGHGPVQEFGGATFFDMPGLPLCPAHAPV